MTGRSSSEPVTTCGSTSSGSCDWTRVTAVWSRCVAASMSVPYSNSIVLIDMPVDADELTASIPSTAATACSSGSVTRCSTTSGDEPGYEATTAPAGNSSEGMSSCLSDPRLSVPNTAIAIVTSATTARFARDRRASRNTFTPVERCCPTALSWRCGLLNGGYALAVPEGQSRLERWHQGLGLILTH